MRVLVGLTPAESGRPYPPPPVLLWAVTPAARLGECAGATGTGNIHMSVYSVQNYKLSAPLQM